MALALASSSSSMRHNRAHQLVHGEAGHLGTSFSNLPLIIHTTIRQTQKSRESYLRDQICGVALPGAGDRLEGEERYCSPPLCLGSMGRKGERRRRRRRDAGMRRSCAHDFFPRKRGMNHYSARKKRERRGESGGVTPDKFAEREGGGEANPTLP